MTLPLPAYEPLPEAPQAASDLIEVAIATLHPTQLCVGMAEIQHRIADLIADLVGMTFRNRL